MKSWSVKTWNFTKFVVTQGGFLLKCVRYSQSLDDDVQIHSLTMFVTTTKQQYNDKQLG